MSYSQNWELAPAKIQRLCAAEIVNSQPMYAAQVVELFDFTRQVRRVLVAMLDMRKRLSVAMRNRLSVADLRRVLHLAPNHQGDEITDWRVLRGGGPSMSVPNAKLTTSVMLPLRHVFALEWRREFLELATERCYVPLASKPSAECACCPHTIGMTVEGDVRRTPLALDTIARSVAG